MKGWNRVLRFFTTLLFTDRGEYSGVVDSVPVEVAAVSGVAFCSVEIKSFSLKIVLAVVVPAAVLCTEVGPGTSKSLWSASFVNGVSVLTNVG